ncbi:hypothetical protein SPV1_03573 [Mariprofundus ferrooxydans PV-1]|uniref:Uncharacterized protein n=1 Tax=Mariprofundus ferrooxydans PV-1 TaxID=314345 RepID=Q0F3S6_9PROT|nr:hypothetical protein SPV1_03573 [Mariprofundus ferrooxydans PV-1]
MFQHGRLMPDFIGQAAEKGIYAVG